MKIFLNGIAAGVLALVSTTGFAAASKPTDAQIARIVVRANVVDIHAGEMAKKNASSQDVKDFAQRMVVDHTGVNKEATALVSKLNVMPEESATSKSLQNDSVKTLARLKNLKGAAFDKAYIDNEVAYHQIVLDTIDKTLLPNASNAELKDLITKVRPAIDAHLQHAKSLQAKLNKRPAA